MEFSQLSFKKTWIMSAWRELAIDKVKTKQHPNDISQNEIGSFLPPLPDVKSACIGLTRE
jgi:hypothetical protein